MQEEKKMAAGTTEDILIATCNRTGRKLRGYHGGIQITSLLFQRTVILEPGLVDFLSPKKRRSNRASIYPAAFESWVQCRQHVVFVAFLNPQI